MAELVGFRAGGHRAASSLSRGHWSHETTRVVYVVENKVLPASLSAWVIPHSRIQPTFIRSPRGPDTSHLTAIDDKREGLQKPAAPPTQSLAVSLLRILHGHALPQLLFSPSKAIISLRCEDFFFSLRLIYF